MLRTNLTLLALTAALLVPAASQAASQAEMCQGQPATIVWDGGSGGAGTDGDDVIVARPDADDIRIAAGGGDDVICVSGNQPPNAYYFLIDGNEGHDSLEVRFDDVANKLEVFRVEGLDIDLGGGFDKLLVADVDGTGTIVGGSDSAALQIRATTLDVDLESGTLRIDEGRYALTGFHRVSAWARHHLAMTGDDQGNGFRAKGCHVTLRGGDGDDVLSARTRPYSCSSPTMRLLGEQGDDRLVGSPSGDVLLGGSGRDSANGMRGKDRCVAERKYECER